MTTEKKQRKYSADDITGYTRDLEKIQAKPTLYIGPTDSDGVFTILRECLDNAVDEARAGRNSLVNVVIEKDGVWVQDAGVGIPVTIHKKMKINTLTHVLTNLQSSGKMKVDGAYASAIGTHGVGIKATNALSEYFEVWTFREKEGGWHYTRFEHGFEKKPVKASNAPKVPGFGKAKSGTVIHFKPDAKVFDGATLDMKRVAGWARMTSYMNSGLLIRVTAGDKTKEWKAKDGIKEYLSDRIETLKATPLSKKFVFHNSNHMEMALSFADVEGSQVEFFTNTVRNVEEGVHADDMNKALFDSLKPYMKEKKAKKKKGEKEDKWPCTPQDVRDGLVGILNYKIDAPQFDSQTKEKLVDKRVKGACYEECLTVFKKFWDDNKSLAKDVVKRASELRSKTADFLKDKKLIKNVNAARKGMQTKLAGVVGKTPVELRELFLVEGDSAGGGCKRARDKTYQAVYPLRGKPLNPIDTKKEKINANVEIVGLLAALGMDLNAKDPIKTVKYGKIILLADPDVDGMHINCLLTATLWKYTPHLVKGGHVYAVKAPLYKGRVGKDVYFGMTKDEVYEKAKSKKIDITYIKGWGEIDEEDLSVALDPGTRKLYRITAPDAKASSEFFQLMGANPAYRKKLLGVI